MIDLRDPSILYNCHEDNNEPDWSKFDALELGGCAELTICDETFVDGGIDRYEAEFFTVYGHLKEGGVEAITDIEGASFERAKTLAHRIAKHAGLPLHITC